MRSLEENTFEDLELMMILKSIPMFNELDFESLFRVGKTAVFKRAAGGEALVIKGEKGQSFYVLLEGRANVYLTEGAEAIASIGPGDLFGELSVIDQKERTATVRAMEDVLMLEFNGAQFLDLLVNNGAIAFSVAKSISRRLRSMLEA